MDKYWQNSCRCDRRPRGSSSLWTWWPILTKIAGGRDRHQRSQSFGIALGIAPGVVLGIAIGIVLGIVLGIALGVAP